MGSSPSRPSSRISDDILTGNTSDSRPNTSAQGARNPPQPRLSVASAPRSAQQVGFREVQLHTPVPDTGEGSGRGQERNRHTTDGRSQERNMIRREQTVVSADEQPTYSVCLNTGSSFKSILAINTISRSRRHHHSSDLIDQTICSLILFSDLSEL